MAKRQHVRRMRSNNHLGMAMPEVPFAMLRLRRRLVVMFVLFAQFAPVTKHTANSANIRQPVTSSRFHVPT